VPVGGWETMLKQTDNRMLLADESA
jgi:hypothetical protein